MFPLYKRMLGLFLFFTANKGISAMEMRSYLDCNYKTSLLLCKKLRSDIREILSKLYKYKDVELIAGAVCMDDVHLSVEIPPKMCISNFMGYLKRDIQNYKVSEIKRFDQEYIA